MSKEKTMTSIFNRGQRTFSVFVEVKGKKKPVAKELKKNCSVTIDKEQAEKLIKNYPKEIILMAHHEASLNGGTCKKCSEVLKEKELAEKKLKEKDDEIDVLKKTIKEKDDQLVLFKEEVELLRKTKK